MEVGRNRGTIENGHITVLVYIIFHASMRRFQSEIIYYFTYFSTVVPSNSYVFFSCRPFIVNNFSAGLVGGEGVEVSLTQLLDGTTVEK